MTFVKICGLTNKDQLIAACRAGADYAGLVFAAGSKRQVSLQDARGIVQVLQNRSPRPKIVGIFANQNIEEINRIARECSLDYVQLSGNETASDCACVQYPVIKVIHIRNGMTSRDVLYTINSYAISGLEQELLFLLDSGNSNSFGGTGITFNWQIACEVSAEHAVIIGGGLNPENVKQLINEVNPWGVDVSSGVETGGVKDINKIKAFIEAVRFQNKMAGTVPRE